MTFTPEQLSLIHRSLVDFACHVDNPKPDREAAWDLIKEIHNGKTS